jgi:hypothetical protein
MGVGNEECGFFQVVISRHEIPEAYRYRFYGRMAGEWQGKKPWSGSEKSVSHYGA